MLIASNGCRIPGAAIRQALALSGGEPVAVVTIARIYGSSLGLPNPGLLPTRKEMDEQKGYVQRRWRRSSGGASEAWGQVAASRKPVKTIAPGGSGTRGAPRVRRPRGAAHAGAVWSRATWPRRSPAKLGGAVPRRRVSLP